MTAPKKVRSANCKGHFKTGDGRSGYPLTITDGYSRFLLGCEALSSTRVQEAKPVFTHVCKAFGWPQRIRTDHGVPFATNTLARLSQLSAWWCAWAPCRSSLHLANRNSMAAMSAGLAR